MRRNLLIWGVPAVLYAVFFAWYTNLSGPLSEAEIEKNISYMETDTFNIFGVFNLR